MTDEEKACILGENYFFHVTAKSNLPSIWATGLTPDCSDWEAYKTWLKQPAVFLCTSAALQQAKAMFDDGLNQERYVVLRIPAYLVAQHECDVDHSFPDRTRGLDLIQCLAKAGYIACYGAISVDAIEVVEHQNDHGQWQDGA